MVDFFTVFNRVYFLGNTGEPLVYYYADSDKSVEAALYDVNGGMVSSISYNMRAGINTIRLGDWLSNYIQDEGYYIIRLGNAWFTMVASVGSISTPEPRDRIKKIIVYDKVTGLYLALPTNTPTVPYVSSRFVTFIYYHDDANRLGKLIIIDGTNMIETDWARYAIIELSIKFNSVDDLYGYIVRYLDDNSSEAAEVIGRIANRDKADATRIAAMYHISAPVGDLLDWSIDLDNLVITMRLRVRLGWGWDSVWSALKYIAAGAVVGAGIAAAVGVAVGSLGVGAVAGGAIVGAALGLAYNIISDSNNKEWQKKIDEVASRGVSNVESAYSDAISTLDKYYESGEISSDAYEKLKVKITEIKDVAVKSIKEVAEEAKECYNAGYNDCKKRYIIFTIGAAVLGYLLGGR